MNLAAIRETEARHLMPTYKRPPVVFVRGRGCFLYDQKGRSYLDFLTGIGVNALGYAHPRLTRAIRAQAGRAIHISNLFHNAYQAPLAQELARRSGLPRVFFTNSGTEAIEGALKLARLNARTNGSSPKARILALEESFHGRTFGALAVTAPAKYREPFAPLLPGVEFVRRNDIADLEAKLGPDVAALILETIQGEGGIYPLSGEFYRRARELTRHHGTLLIADEIQCGCGRTGHFLAWHKFVNDSASDAPDITLLAKPLAGGLPLGAILAREEVGTLFTVGSHGTTFGGGPLACAAALAFLRALDEENLLRNVRARGRELRAGLEQLGKKFSWVKEVRGEGLMLAMELEIEGAPVVKAALQRGLIINCTHDRVLRFLPAFIVGPREVALFFERLEAALKAVDRQLARKAS